MLEKKQYVLDKIKEYNKIFIFRHFRPDGDAVGSTKGLRDILRLTFPEKEILLQNADFSDYLAFLGGEDELQPDESYADALALVLDTGTEKRVSNQKFKLCREVVDTCGDVRKVDDALNMLTRIYGEIGEYGKAKEAIERISEKVLTMEAKHNENGGN